MNFSATNTRIPTRTCSISPRLWARVAGACYLIIFVAAPSGAATATPARMIITLACDTAVALLFYYLFTPLDRPLSFLAASIRLIYVAWMSAVSLNYFGDLPFRNGVHSAATFNAGYRIGVAIFGFHCLLIGYLILRSTYLPGFLGVLMLLAGLGWLTFFSSHLAISLSPYNLVPGALGEGVLTLEPVINLQEQHMLPECSKPAQNALPVRCDAECIYCFLLNSGCLVKSAMIPLGLRVQS